MMWQDNTETSVT